MYTDYFYFFYMYVNRYVTKIKSNNEYLNRGIIKLITYDLKPTCT